MKLDALLERLVPVTAEVRKASCEVTSICDDSRAAVPGCLFVARSGTRSDGRAFVADAVAKGAVAVLHSGEDPCAGAPGADRVLRVRLR